MITSGIGSFPFVDIDEAIDLIFSACPQVPFWPQLPKRAPVEDMYHTFLEGVPCLRYDDAGLVSHMDTTETEGIEAFYDDYFAGNLAAFSLSPTVAPGFYRFLDRLPEIIDGVRYIKGQLTGPFSMGLGLKDEEGKPILYNDAYFDIVKKALRMKAQWMIATFTERFPGKDLIIFFDEPYLVSFGSAYVSVSREQTIALLNEVLEGLGARRGVHCCGNTDWSVLFNAQIDLINYDAYEYRETIFYYPDDLKRFFVNGGSIAAGIVPSSEKVVDSSVQELAANWKDFLARAAAAGISTGAQNWIVTPSCGLGSLTPAQARRAMELLKELPVAVEQ